MQLYTDGIKATQLRLVISTPPLSDNDCATATYAPNNLKSFPR